MMLRPAGARTLLSASPVPPARDDAVPDVVFVIPGRFASDVLSDAENASVRTGVSALLSYALLQSFYYFFTKSL